MNLRDTPEEAAWRQEVREFIEKELPQQFKDNPLEDESAAALWNDPDMQAWRRKLVERGWIAPSWPKEYGGAGLSLMQQFIMGEEMAEARAPSVGGAGISMVGPSLIVHGTEQQKKDFLPKILSGEILLCQGFSEPEAGSDLASLRTRAVRDGDDFVINGQKIWTSVAHHANWMFLLARTDPDVPKHKGITYFLLEMKTPGIDVRPLPDITGDVLFNEVFFDNVRVPAKNIVGEENRGWYIAATTLDFERASAIGAVVQLRQTVERLIRLAKQGGKGSALSRNPLLRLELADRMIEVQVVRMMAYQIVSMLGRGLIPNYQASMLKTFATETAQRVARTGMSVLGMRANLYGDDAPEKGIIPRSYLSTLGLTIAAGTSEIQRNIIAQRGLGLPRP
ncbi:MAG: acyl-CoA dehydrogenase family protein [Dehalococcoidia bacterium]|nr:acyl-CoA dehydrogenase family protein [Dehalococcoidia bacterium]